MWRPYGGEGLEAEGEEEDRMREDGWEGQKRQVTMAAKPSGWEARRGVRTPGPQWSTVLPAQGPGQARHFQFLPGLECGSTALLH